MQHWRAQLKMNNTLLTLHTTCSRVAIKSTECLWSPESAHQRVIMHHCANSRAGKNLTVLLLVTHRRFDGEAEIPIEPNNCIGLSLKDFAKRNFAIFGQNTEHNLLQHVNVGMLHCSQTSNARTMRLTMGNVKIHKSPALARTYGLGWFSFDDQSPLVKVFVNMSMRYQKQLRKRRLPLCVSPSPFPLPAPGALDISQCCCKPQSLKVWLRSPEQKHLQLCWARPSLHINDQIHKQFAK